MKKPFTVPDKKSLPGRIEVRECEKNTLRAMELIAKSALRPALDESAWQQKRDSARMLASIYEEVREFDGRAVTELMAADASDANIGVLSGTLPALKTLDQFAYQDPAQAGLMTDFSDEEARFNQTVNSRAVTLATVMAFDPAIGAANEPNAWKAATPGRAIDAPVKLDEFVGVNFRFTLDQVSSTKRDLFGEQSSAAALALSNYFMQKAYKLMTPANFNAYALVNAPTVPVAYVTYPKAQADFGKSALVDIEGIFDANKVPQAQRMALLNQAYTGQLGKDGSIHICYGCKSDYEAVQKGEFPLTASFTPAKSPGLLLNNATANLVGFAMQRSAIMIACLPPDNLEKFLPKALSNGQSLLITHPDTGLTMLLIMSVSQHSGYVQWTLAGLLGAAVADKSAGLCITSQ